MDFQFLVHFICAILDFQVGFLWLFYAKPFDLWPLKKVLRNQNLRCFTCLLLLGENSKIIPIQLFHNENPFILWNFRLSAAAVTAAVM